MNLARKIYSSLIDCEVKYTNEDGKWLTANLLDLNEGSLEDVAKQFTEDSEENSVKLCGITSARVRMDVDEEKIYKLGKDEKVFFADYSDIIIRHYLDLDDSVKIRVFDLAWDIMK